MTDEAIAEAIHDDLLRQQQGDNYDSPWVDEFHDLTSTNIDGRVNLIELARAVIAAIDACPNPSKSL